MTHAKHFKAALFDIDGTVENTKEFIYCAFESVFGTLKHPPVPRNVIAPLIGLPLKDIYNKFAPDEPFEYVRDLHNDFQMKNLHLIKPYAGIHELLETLSRNNVLLAAVSSRKREVVEATLTHSNLIHFFKKVVGPYDTPHHKPHPAPLLHALTFLGCDARNAIMIGDSYIDIEAGKNAGTHTMRVTYGFNSEKLHDPEPDYIAHEAHDIAKYIM